MSGFEDMFDVYLTIKCENYKINRFREILEDIWKNHRFCCDIEPEEYIPSPELEVVLCLSDQHKYRFIIRNSPWRLLVLKENSLWLEEGYDIEDFLKLVQDLGLCVFESLAMDSKFRIPTEDKILFAFVKQGEIRGKFYRKMRVGISREADAICLDEFNNYWVFEVKEKLNYESIGQILVYKTLFLTEKSIDPWDVNAAIVCLSADSELKSTCEMNDIKVFVLPLGSLHRFRFFEQEQK